MFFCTFLLPIGPSAPLVPVLGDIIVSHNSVLIRFTITSIAYTRETYVVEYGKQINNLNYTSSEKMGSSNFNAVNQSMLIILFGLMPDTTYYYRLRANNSQSSTDTTTTSFRTKASREFSSTYTC